MTLAPESFPTQIRGKGNGLIAIFGTIGGVLSPVFTGLLLDQSGGFEISICCFTVFYALCTLSILFLRETRISQGKVAASNDY